MSQNDLVSAQISNVC